MLFPNSKIQKVLLIILIHFLCESMQCCIPEFGFISCYIYVTEGNTWHQNIFLFIPMFLFIVEKHYLKKNCLFLTIVWNSMRIIEKFCCCLLIPPIEKYIYNCFYLSMLLISNATLRIENTSQIIFSYLLHWIIWTPSLSVYFYFFLRFVSQPNCSPFPSN